MSATSREPGLLIVDFDGTPRSGKGTSAENAVERFPRTVISETGVWYRTITYLGLEGGRLEPGMDESTVRKKMSRIPAEEVFDMAWHKDQIIKTEGRDALYSRYVGGLVGKVSPLENVRLGVKKRLRDELTQHLHDSQVSMVILDGRNLGAVATDIEGLSIINRTFFVCSDNEAANRELKRELAKRAERGQAMTEEEQEEYRNAKLTELRNRRKDDEKRGLDPVHPDPEAVRYWDNPDITELTVKAIKRQLGCTRQEAYEAISVANHYRYSRIGAGTLAYSLGVRQIVYDTNSRNLAEMLDDTEIMIRESLEAHAQRGNIG